MNSLINRNFDEIQKQSVNVIFVANEVGEGQTPKKGFSFQENKFFGNRLNLKRKQINEALFIIPSLFQIFRFGFLRQNTVSDSDKNEPQIFNNKC